MNWIEQHTQTNKKQNKTHSEPSIYSVHNDIIGEETIAENFQLIGSHQKCMYIYMCTFTNNSAHQ